jgi:hypothetical protein
MRHWSELFYWPSKQDANGGLLPSLSFACDAILYQISVQIQQRGSKRVQNKIRQCAWR